MDTKIMIVTVQVMGLVFVSWLQLVLFPIKKEGGSIYKRREREIVLHKFRMIIVIFSIAGSKFLTVPYS